MVRVMGADGGRACVTGKPIINPMLSTKSSKIPVEVPNFVASLLDLG